MLIRDLPTSYEEAGAATIRHEIWQYDWNYGGWQKRNAPRCSTAPARMSSELRQWTWLWDPKLGGIEVGTSPLTIRYELPRNRPSRSSKGCIRISGWVACRHDA